MSRRSFDPHFYNYPALFFNLHSGLLRVLHELAGPAGLTDPAARPHHPVVLTVGTGVAPVPETLLLLRLQALLLSAAAAALVTVVARRLGASQLPAALAGLLFAAAPLATATGAALAPDGPAAVFVLCCLWASSGPPNRRGDLLLAGLCAGAAAACKYTAGGVVLVPLLAAVRTPRALLVLGAGAGWGFLVGNPTLLTAPTAVLDGIAFEAAHYRGGHAGAQGDALVSYLSALGRSLGPAALLVPAALIGRPRKPALAVLAFAALTVAVLGRYNVHFDRNVLPLLGPLAALAGAGAGAAVERLRTREPSVRAALVGLLVLPMAITIAWSLPESRAVTRARHHESLHLAHAWLAEHAPPGTRVLVEGYGPSLADLPLSTRYAPSAHQAAGDLLTAPPHFDLLVLAEAAYGRYLAAPAAHPDELAAYRALFPTWCELTRFEGGGSITILARESDLADPSACPGPLAERFRSARPMRRPSPRDGSTD